MKSELEDLENSSSFHTARYKKLCFEGKFEAVVGQPFAIKRAWVWFMGSINHFGRNAASWTERARVRTKWRRRLSDFWDSPDRPKELSSLEHPLFFQKREEWLWRWFGTWQAATVTSDSDSIGQGGGDLFVGSIKWNCWPVSQGLGLLPWEGDTTAALGARK